MIHYKKAVESDAEFLTETACISKQHWGYTDEQIKGWESELTITKEHINKNMVYKVYMGDEYIGFFSLVKFQKWTELAHLWILPPHLRKGYGKTLFEKIKELLANYSERILEVYADPNANGFYEKMGGEIHKQIKSTIPERAMNVYRIQL